MIRHLDIAQFNGRIHNIYHAPAFNHDLTVLLFGRINNLLHTVYIGCKSRYNNTAFGIFFKNCIEGLPYRTLRLCETRI